MTLATTSIGDNGQAPGIAAEVYLPDQLIAGNQKIVTDTVTLGAGTLPRGSVLGKITASGNYILSVKTAGDGSQNPVAVLADVADASGGAVQCGVYLTGELNGNALNFDASWTLAGLKDALRPLGIFVKSAVSAADPT
jgi:hypothetical protein